MVVKSEFGYDYASRRAFTREYDFANGGWANPIVTRDVFDGLDVVQERNSSNQVTAQLVRDGNIGGILSRTTAAGAAFYGYDGNGNVTLLTNAAGQDVGRYRYDAFGNTLEVQGARAGENPYRFSTKELHGPSGLYDYGFRFYSPGMGRWLNRDPLSEVGGVNLYAMLGNDPINAVDDYGLRKKKVGQSFAVISAIARVAVSSPLAVMLGTLAVTAKPVGDGTLTGSKGYAGPLRPPVQGPPKPGSPPAAFPSGSGKSGGSPRKPKDDDEEPLIRVRHFTSISGLALIQQQGVLRANDSNRVFTVRARRKPGSPRDVEKQLGIGVGRGNAYVDFNAKPSEFEIRVNSSTGATEYVFLGSIDLDDRLPSYRRNR